MKFLYKPVLNYFDFIMMFLCQIVFMAGYWYISLVLILVSIPISVHYQIKYWELSIKENK